MAGAGGGGGGGGAAAAGQQQAPAAAGAVDPAEFAAAAAEADPERRRDVIARFWERLTPEQREVLSGLLRMPTSAPDTEIGMNLPKPKRKASPALQPVCHAFLSSNQPRHLQPPTPAPIPARPSSRSSWASSTRWTSTTTATGAAPCGRRSTRRS